MARIVALYAAFAAISIVVNIATQMACVAVYGGPNAIPASIAAGTFTGLVAKYLLDKRWIYAHAFQGATHEVRTFLLYSLMGVATTGLFWGTEYAFHSLFGSDALRYVGGGLGLVAGYVAKYLLDSHFVFRSTVQASRS